MKLFVEDINSNQALLIGQNNDTTPSGYLDKTNMLDIGVTYKDKLLNLLEYNSIRDWILELLLSKNPDMGTAFGLCSTIEKVVVCKYILMPYSVRLLFFADDQDAEHWDELVVRTEGSPYALLTGRSKVYQNLRRKVSDYVRREVWTPGDYFGSLSKAQQFLRDVEFMKNLFIASNDPEFKEFLNSNGRYDATTGFKSKDYWLQDLEDDLLTIYNSY